MRIICPNSTKSNRCLANIGNRAVRRSYSSGRPVTTMGPITIWSSSAFSTRPATEIWAGRSELHKGILCSTIRSPCYFREGAMSSRTLQATGTRPGRGRAPLEVLVQGFPRSAHFSLTWFDARRATPTSDTTHAPRRISTWSGGTTAKPGPVRCLCGRVAAWPASWLAAAAAYDFGR